MSSFGEADFSDVLERARAGDPVARDELFRRLGDDRVEGPRVLALARQVLPPDDHARQLVESCDLMQSALRCGWIDLSKFRGGSEAEFFAWLRQILYHRLNRVVRRRRPRFGLEVNGEKREVDPPAAGPSPLSTMMGEEARKRLSDAIARLPEDQSAVIDLRLKGLTTAEIGERLDLRPDAVRKRESRALARLRRQFE